MIIGYFLSLGAWAWFLIALFLALVELILPTTFFIWLSLAAVLVGTADLIFDLSTKAELIMFVVSMPPSLYLGFYLNKTKPEEDVILHQRTLSLVGGNATVQQAVENGRGKLEVGDTTWLAEGEDCEVGTEVKIVGSEGSVLKFEKIN